MVLTNFECWAYGGSDGRGSMFADSVIERRTIPSTIDLFNPSALQSCGQVDNSNKIVSHLSSNGYYGFVPVAAFVDTASDDVIEKQQQQNVGGNTDEIIATNKQTLCIEDMDVEQHSQNDSYNNNNRRNFSPHFWIENFDLRNCQARKRTHDDNGCSIDRRKRLFAEEDILEVRKRAKRCRFDSHREHIFANNGGCILPSSCGETNTTFPLNMDHEYGVHLSSVSNSLTEHPASLSSSLVPADEVQPTPVSTPSAVAVVSAGTKSNTKRTFNTNIKLSEKLSTHNFIQKTHLKTSPKNLCEENGSSCHPNNNFSDVCNNFSNKLTENDDSTHYKYENLNANTDIINSNAIIIDDRPIDTDYDDDQLENLFLHLHGGNDHHLRRHLEDDNYCEDI